jgi:hypothetical protein
MALMARAYNQAQIGSLHRTPAGFTVLVLDGYGLRD